MQNCKDTSININACHTYKHTHTYTHSYTHTHTYSHTYIYTPTYPERWLEVLSVAETDVLEHHGAVVRPLGVHNSFVPW
jgi:hypothetical protein